MTYFNHQPRQRRYRRNFQQEPSATQVFSVDEDGDRIYTEEDYGVAPDGDAFLPDEADEVLDESAFPLTYMGAYDTLEPMPDEAEWAPEMTDEVLDDELLTEEDRAELRRSNWKLAANLADFGSIIVGTAAILVLIALLVSLLNWLVNDVSQSFTLLQMHM